MMPRPSSASWSRPTSPSPAPKEGMISCSRRPALPSSPTRSRRRSSPSGSPNVIRTSMCWRTATRRKSGRWSPRPEDARPEDQGDRDLRARAGLHRHSEAVTSNSRGRSRRTRRATSARRAGSPSIARTGLHHAGRKRRRGRDLHLPHSRGCDRRERSRPVDRVDNLRKGAALNAIQIAELLVARGLIQPKQKAA